MSISRSSCISLSAAVVALLESHAFAATCRTVDRPWPGLNPPSDFVTIECQLNNLANASATLATTRQGAVKQTRANLLTGAGQIAKAFGLDSSGGTLASCTATDDSPGNGATDPVNCPAGQKWKGEVSYDL